MTFGSATVIKAFQGAELLSRLRIDRKMCPEFIPWQRRPTRSCLSSIALFVVESLTEGSSSGRQDWFGARKRKSSCEAWKGSFRCCAVDGFQVSVAETVDWCSFDTRETCQSRLIPTGTSFVR